MTSRRLASGFSLIELMVALVLGLLVTGAAFAILQSNQATYRSNEGLNRIQENARIAFELMSRDIRAAGGSACSRYSEIMGSNAEATQFSGSPIQGEVWGLDLGLDVTTNKSKVLDLGGVQPFAPSTGLWIENGSPVPVVRTRWVRNGDKPVPAGQTLGLCTAAAAVADASLPCMDFNHNYGPAQPTLTLGPNLSVRVPYGVTLSARGEFRGGFYTTESNFTEGGVSRSAVNGDSGVLGYTEATVEPMIECEVSLRRGQRLGDKSFVGATVIFVCDSGQRFVLEDAFTTDAIDATGGDGGGKVPLKISAMSCTERS